MTDSMILQKVMEKAIANGYKPFGLLEAVLDGKIGLGMDPNVYNWLVVENQYFAHIFSHEFLKAFFGEKDMWKETKCTCGGVDFHIAGHDVHREGCARIKADRGWKFHAKQLVVESEPLKYLEKHL